jgi:hypothetical protein
MCLKVEQLNKGRLKMTNITTFGQATRGKKVCGQGGTFRIRSGANGGTPRTVKIGQPQ